jgi:hypothetical protein
MSSGMRSRKSPTFEALHAQQSFRQSKARAGLAICRRQSAYSCSITFAQRSKATAKVDEDVDCGEFALRCGRQTLVTKQTSSHCFCVRSIHAWGGYPAQSPSCGGDFLQVQAARCVKDIKGARRTCGYMLSKRAGSRSLSPTPCVAPPRQVIGTHPSISDFRILLRLFKARALAPRTNILPASTDRQFPALTHAKGRPHAPPVWSRPFSFWAFRVWGKSNTEVETTAPVPRESSRIQRISKRFAFVRRDQRISQSGTDLYNLGRQRRMACAQCWQNRASVRLRHRTDTGRRAGQACHPRQGRRAYSAMPERSERTEWSRQSRPSEPARARRFTWFVPSG